MKADDATSNDGIILKSLVLSAGLGTRLRPLTDIIPKPLAPVCDVPLFDAAVRKCIEAGSLDFAINVHHLAKVMASHATENQAALGIRSLHVSEELPEILGTGGALIGISKWWGQSSLLVYNGDVLSDMSLKTLVAKHFEAQPLVTMAVRRTPPTDGGRSVWVDHEGNVLAIAKKADLPPHFKFDGVTEFGFACAYVTNHNLRRFLPSAPQFFDIIEGFNAAIRSGQKIMAVEFQGFWADVGNPRSLWETNLQVAAMPENQRKKLLGIDTLNAQKSSSISNSIDRSSVISKLAVIHHTSQIRRSVVLGKEVIVAQEVLDHAIRGYGLNLNFAD